MATALSAQLAQISANSTHQLDLKAQRKAHAKSLIFNEPVATFQDFDSLYQLCFEGYEELCRLDSRFIEFSRNVFSEHSKTQDRSRLSADQNQELDEILERFLSLAEPKLLLKPTVKAIEWLVRRFRIHEYNTDCFILTCLSYHEAPIFANVLSVLPRKLTAISKFLLPYAQSLSNPPRQAIVTAATYNLQFFAAWSNHIMKTSKAGYGSRSIVTFWAGVIAEAVAGQVDQTISGKRELQLRKEHDILLRLIPILSEGLTLSTSIGLRTSSLMILLVTISKISLEKKTIRAMMEAIVNHGAPETLNSELICLSILVEKQASKKLPRAVSKFLLRVDRLGEKLLDLGRKYDVGAIILSLIGVIMKRSWKEKVERHLELVDFAISRDLMNSEQLADAFGAMLLTLTKYSSLKTPSRTFRMELANLIIHHANKASNRDALQRGMTITGLEIQSLEQSIQEALSLEVEELSSDEKVNGERILNPGEREQREAAELRLKVHGNFRSSFMRGTESSHFDELIKDLSFLFTTSKGSVNFGLLFGALEHSIETKLSIVTFLARVWTGRFPARLRTAALNWLPTYLQDPELQFDPQIIFPYLIYALSDDSSIVRRSCADMILKFVEIYQRILDNNGNENSLPILGRETAYEPDKSVEIQWLKRSESQRLLETVLVPNLEECRIDELKIGQVLEVTLRGGDQHGLEAAGSHIDEAARLSLFECLCNHAHLTPVYNVKFRLLSVLNKVQRWGSLSKSTALIPILRWAQNMDQESWKSLCDSAKLDQTDFAAEVLKITFLTQKESQEILQQLLTMDGKVSPWMLRRAALTQLNQDWKLKKPDVQISLALTLFQLAQTASQNLANSTLASEACGTLRSIELPSEIILRILSLAIETPIDIENEDEPHAKRQKVEVDQMETRARTETRPNAAFIQRNMSFALELVGASEGGKDSQLLPILFQYLHFTQSQLNWEASELNYIQSMILTCIKTIIHFHKRSQASKALLQSIRPDLIVNTFKTTANPQVHQTALLLMSELASAIPDQVIHEIMPMMTYLSTNILRRADDYSAHVINQSIESVVPPLLTSLRATKSNPLIGVSDLLACFVSAFEHIPTSRRLKIFSMLMGKVGETEFLYVLCSLLVNHLGNHEDGLKFAVELCRGYSELVQVKTIEETLNLIVDLKQPRPGFSKYIFHRGDASLREENGLKLISFCSELLSNRSLRRKAAEALVNDKEVTSEVLRIFSKITERVLDLASPLKLDEKWQMACADLQSALLTALPMEHTIKSLRTLIDSGNGAIRQQALSSLAIQVENTRTGNIAARKACTELVPSLTSVIRTSSNVEVRQSVIICVDRIAEKCGKASSENFLTFAQIILSEGCIDGSSLKLRTVSILCLTTLVEVLGENAIPLRQQILTQGLDQLEAEPGTTEWHEDLYWSACSLFKAIFLYIPWMFSKNELERFLRLLFESTATQVSMKSTQVRTEALYLMAKHSESPTNIVTLKKAFESAISSGPKAVFEGLNLVSSILDEQKKVTIVKSSIHMVELFTLLLDIRRCVNLATFHEGKYREEQILCIEEDTSNAMIKMIYKVNDASFRPLFGQMSEWATQFPSSDTESKGILRLSSWFFFLKVFFGTLKSIVTTYAGFVVDIAAESLKNIQYSSSESLQFRDRVLQTLQAAFENDQDEYFCSPARFNAISRAILAQISYAPRAISSSYLVSCVTSLAVAAHSQEHRKSINQTILSHFRSDISRVRLTAVLCQISLSERLGEDWLSLLPEMLPFISEALEDDDESVESESRRWVKIIESTMGMSLDGMLQ